MKPLKVLLVSTTTKIIVAIILSLAGIMIANHVLANPNSRTEITEKTVPPNFSAVEIAKIHTTVTAFLHALRHKQPENLKMLASVQMRGQFVNSTDMMRLMTKIHLPIISTNGLFMHNPEMRDGYIVQSIHFLSADNKPWKAAYFLVRDSEGNLGISGCHIKRMQGRFA